MAQLIKYDAQPFVGRFDRSMKFYQGLVQVIDLRTNKIRYVEKVKIERISKTTAIEDAKKLAEELRVKNRKFIKGKIHVKHRPIER